MNIFILCAGKGTRFDSILPKPLNLVNGKAMIYHTISSLNLDKVLKYKLYIIYNKKLDVCNFKEILINMFPKIEFNFILIDYYTRGASESAYIGLMSVYEKLDNNNILFIDNDTIYPEETWTLLNNKYEYNFIFTNFNNEKDPIYSYVSVDVDNFVQEIKEKDKISDLICIGCYGFKNKDEYVRNFKEILDLNEKSKNEFYMSLMYDHILRSKMTQKESSVLNITINKTISLGTPNQLINSERIGSGSLTYVFDLDNTLVTYPVIHGDYSTVKPIMKMINLVRKLKENGHYIIINTARRMKTHSGKVGAVIKDIGRVTLDTLDKFNIPYDELIFGKPLGDIYIDDRAYNPYDDRLFKLIGEYQLINDDIDNKIENNKYNSIKCVDERIIKKVSKYIGKGELFFYENINLLSETVQKYFVGYYGYKILNESIELNIAKIDGIPISYLYINKTYSLKLFDKLLYSLKEIHSIQLDNKLDVSDYENNYILKLKKRFEDKEIYNFDGADKIYDELINSLEDYNSRIKNNICSVIHGDFWFSNILISYKDEYKFIDMKGLVNERETLSGDKIYDYAKILQSLIGFDSILYDKEIDLEYNKIFIEYFKKWILENDKDVLFEDIELICKVLIFGVFHAYNLENMSLEKKMNVVKLLTSSS
jgi:capsule biosynthesis phosphatase